MVIFTASEIANASKHDEGQFRLSPYNMTHSNSDPGPYMANGNEDQQLHSQPDLLSEQAQPEFDVQPSVDRIPGSSYVSEDRQTFSWVNVTGQYCVDMSLW